ncbi:7,8-dihydroneopterin aldolase [Candidatus Electronema halotolerans]
MKTVVHITNLRLRAIIGINDWERSVKQDVVINICIEYNAEKASRTDKIEDAFNYKTLTKHIIREVEESSYHLLEALSARIMHIITENTLVLKARVKVEKPGALRYSDSVGIEISTD